MTPEQVAECEKRHRRESRDLADKELAMFYANLEPKDWLFDGRALKMTNERDREMWRQLRWNEAWIDMGPSPAGNPGPYWKVPRTADGDETVHRLYPKVLRTRHLLVIRAAMILALRKYESET